MPRPKPEPKPKKTPAPKKSPGTTPTQMRLTPDDLAAADKIMAHYHLDSRAAATRLALRHVAANLRPLTLAPTKAGAEKEKR